MDARHETATVRVVVTAPDVRLVDAVLSRFLVWWNTEGHTSLVVPRGAPMTADVTWHSSSASVTLPVTFTWARPAQPQVAPLPPPPAPTEVMRAPESELVDEFFSEADSMRPASRNTTGIAGMLQPIVRRRSASLLARARRVWHALLVVMLGVAAVAAARVSAVRRALAARMPTARAKGRRGLVRVGPQEFLWSGIAAAVVLIVALIGWPRQTEPPAPAPVVVPPVNERTVIAEVITPPEPVVASPPRRRTPVRRAAARAGSTYVMQPAVSRRTLFTGTLQVASEPAGAEVWINGTLVGTTPVRVERVAAGSHAVLVTLPGYQRWTSAARVVSGSPNRLMAVLDPATAVTPVTCGHTHSVSASPCESFDHVRPAATTGIEGEHSTP